MSNRPSNESKPESAREQRDAVLDNERKAHEKQPENFKEEAVDDKLIDLGPVSSDDSNIQDLDPKPEHERGGANESGAAKR